MCPRGLVLLLHDHPADVPAQPHELPVHRTQDLVLGRADALAHGVERSAGPLAKGMSCRPYSLMLSDNYTCAAATTTSVHHPTV